MGKDNKMLLILGGLAVVGAGALYMTQKCGILYPIFKSQCDIGEAKAQANRPRMNQWRAQNPQLFDSTA